MKTYLLHNLNRIAKYSRELDAKAILYDKSWEVFNDDGEKEVLIFMPKDLLLLVRNGIVTNSTWKMLPTGSLLITVDTTTYLFNAAFVEEDVLALELDGHDECMILIESNKKKKLLLDTISKVEKYLEDKHAPVEEPKFTKTSTDGESDATNIASTPPPFEFSVVLLVIIFILFSFIATILVLSS